MALDWISITAIVLIAFIVITYLIKRFVPGTKAWVIISMIRSKKPIKYFKKFSKHKKFINYFADLGLILGFGAVAVDYLFGKKLVYWKRILLFAVSAAILYVVYSLSLGLWLSGNPLIKSVSVLFALSFAILGFAGFALASIVYQAFDIIFKLLIGKKPCPGVAPLIPGIQIPNVPIFVPLHAWISLLIILVLHEGMHGITAIKEKIRIKSSGILLFGILPIGAFVEPDEAILKKANERAQLRIYASGPMANIATIPIAFLVFLAITLLIVVPFVSPWASQLHKDSISGIEIASVDENYSICGDVFPSPAFGEIQAGWRIVKVNDQNVFFAAEVQNIFSLSENKTFKLTFLDDQNKLIERNITLNELNLPGFKITEIQSKEFPLYYQAIVGTYNFLNEFFGWLILLCLLVAIVNFLPIEPFDGGKIAKIVFTSYLGFYKAPKAKKEKLVSKIAIIIILIVIIINAIPLFLY